MFDIKEIRKNPAPFVAGWKKRGIRAPIDDILAIDEKLRSCIEHLEALQRERHNIARDYKAASSANNGDGTVSMAAKATKLKEDIAAAESAKKKYADELDVLLAALPNIPFESVPVGKDESDNQILRYWGNPPSLENPLDHVALGEKLGFMDFETAARISGARFVFLRNGLAMLERAIANFMVDQHTSENGYTEVSPPLLVRDAAMFGTGQLPNLGEDSFKTENGFWLIPTAEVSLTNYVRETILDEKELPLRFVARTPCFRSEAGAAGRDTRGMIRMHQFQKVELVSITAPQHSADEHLRMTACAEGILQKLGLPYRVVELCTGDMGFAAAKTYDLEVWLPSQNKYREISSCSNCGDFQARRMAARYRGQGDKKPQYVHTLNGSALAVGRTLVAIMENFQRSDGSIMIPEMLHRYTNGVRVLRPE